MADDKEKAQRRVYVLPRELVERIIAYQEELSLPSEVEAVRRLLDGALQSRDTVEKILDKIRDRFLTERDLRTIAAEILTPHQLVKFVSFPEPDSIVFEMRNGDTASVHANGDTFIHIDTGFEEPKLVQYPKPKKASFSGGEPLDDDIPF